jgi:phthalate 4,5-dioxygenase oxygenase subunit
MLTHEENERLVRVAAGTPTGELFRRYWIPALLGHELEADGAPVRVRLLGEDLIAFRDADGAVGLVDAFCPHRRAPMFFARNEECGLRCVYHGWKFDKDGTCFDMPSEPADSLFKSKIKIAAYPTWEGGDVVWTYMGPPDKQPPPPDYEWLRAPATHRFVTKTQQECNWLQALEGGLDTAHSSFLHNESLGSATLLRNRDRSPRLEVEKTPYGFQYMSTRDIGDDGYYVRVYNFVMPAQAVRGMVTKWNAAAREDVPTIHGHLWIPIDDTHTWTYNFMYGYDENVPIDREWAWNYETWTGRGREHLIPGTYRLQRNLSNDYLIDRERQRSKSFTGIEGINTQDIALQEGMGPICDRTKEHLGTTDRAIIVTRQLLLEAGREIEADRPPRGVDPETYRNVRPHDGIVTKSEDWHALEPELVARF